MFFANSTIVSQLSGAQSFTAGGSAGITGYKLPGGLILNIGQLTFTSGGANFTYPTATNFTTNSAVVACPVGTQTPIGVDVGVGNVSTSGFTGYSSNASATTQFIAIGF